MPYNYKSPGVYVEEVERGPRPIESAGTSVLAILGLCAETHKVYHPEKDEIVVEQIPEMPTLVTSLTQFFNLYGTLQEDAVLNGYLHHAVTGYFLNGGTAAFIVGLRVPDKFKRSLLVPQRPPAEGTLLNAAGQETLYLTTAEPLQQGDEISLEVLKPDEGAPDGTFNLAIHRLGVEVQTLSNLNLVKAKGTRVVTEVLPKETSSLLSGRILELQGTPGERAPVPGSKVTLKAINKPPVDPLQDPAIIDELKQTITPDLFKGDAARRIGIAGLEAIEEVTLLACPDAVGYYPGLLSASDVKLIQLAMLNHCESMKDRFAILDCPAGLNVQQMVDWRKNKMGFDSKYGAIYYPWVKVNDRLALPPSGHVAGVYARVDSERGVHKAPANEVVRGISDLELNVSRNEQDLLNPSPINVNCIRSFPGQGIRIWGARTLSTSDDKWRYINVRRLFCNVEESILQSTHWIVFEPNDDILWRQISRDITAFLTVIWRSGALFGSTPEEAFFVKCDRDTNPEELRNLGYCVIEVGLAPVKPAEFVVFRVSQKEDGSGSASEG